MQRDAGDTTGAPHACGPPAPGTRGDEDRRGNCAQGLGGRPEEDPVDHRLILQGDLGDRLGM